MRLFRACLLTLFLFPTLATAQIPTATLAGIAHVAIRVSDLTRSRFFYQKLGFEQAFTLTKDGKTTEAFFKVNDHQFIEIYPQQDPSQSIGFMHLCFESTDLAGLHQRLPGAQPYPYAGAARRRRQPALHHGGH